MKWSVTLTDRLGPEMLTVLEIKGQVLHRVRLHVKVPGLLLNLNALLTKKLPKFLSRLNEMSGGKENMCLVSGSLLRILKFLRMTFFISLSLLSNQFSKAILLDYEDVFKRAITSNRFIDYTGNTNHKPHLFLNKSGSLHFLLHEELVFL